jgi:hypothetical protein
MNGLATSSKNKNIRDLYRGINEFKRGYQQINNLAKDGIGNLLADFHSILNMWKNCSQYNMHNVCDIRQKQVHTAEPLVSDPIHLEVETAIAKLQNYKSPLSVEIPAELIQAGRNITVCEPTH